METTSYPMAGMIGGLAYGFDALWLTLPAEGSVVRLDPATGASDVVADGLPSPRAIAVGSSGVWVGLHGGQEDQAAPGDPQLARIDPSSGQVLAEFAIGGSPQGGVELWAGDGDLLVRSTRPWLTRIDEATSEVVETITSDLPIQGPVTVSDGSIWTTNIERRDVVYRVAP
jgi:streptogramin lyase